MSSSEQSSRYIAIVPAAGIGRRMQAERPKQYLQCAGKVIIWHVLNRFQHCPWIEHIYVSLAEGDPYWDRLIGEQFTKVKIVTGGATRAESVINALTLARTENTSDCWALVHDAARPCLTDNDLDRIKTSLESQSAADGLILADKIHDTVKKANQEGCIDRTESREFLWRAQTPQVFRLGDLLEALNKVPLAEITDEASAIEAQGGMPYLLQGDVRNIKVTQAQDLALAELYLTQRESNK